MAYLVDQSIKGEEQSKTVLGLCQAQPEVLEMAWMAETVALVVLFLVFIPWFYYLILQKCDKIVKKQMWTSIWSVQHPNTNQNRQHMSKLAI